MEDDRGAMKKHMEYCNMLGYVADAQYGIPTCCPCGGSIVDEVAEKEAFDHLPGKRFFTCRKYKDDGLHFRQPWVAGVQEEIKKLRRRVEEDKRRVWPVHDLIAQIQNLKEDVEKLTRRVAELEMVL